MGTGASNLSREKGLKEWQAEWVRFWLGWTKKLINLKNTINTMSLTSVYTQGTTTTSRIYEARRENIQTALTEHVHHP